MPSFSTHIPWPWWQGRGQAATATAATTATAAMRGEVRAADDGVRPMTRTLNHRRALLQGQSLTPYCTAVAPDGGGRGLQVASCALEKWLGCRLLLQED